MQLKTLKMENYCQHELLTIEFAAGVNVVTGPNGAGKSNVFRAAHYALWGSSPDSANLEDDIRHGSESANVTLSLVVNNQEVEIRRTLKPRGSSAWLKVGDGVPIRGVSAVNSAVADLIGCQAEAAGQLVAVRQGHLTDLLEATPSRRKEIFGQILGTATCERLRLGLADELKQPFLAEVVFDRSPEQLEADITLLTDKVAAFRTHQAALGKAIESVDYDKTVREIHHAVSEGARIDNPITGLGAARKAVQENAARVTGASELADAATKAEVAALQVATEARREADGAKAALGASEGVKRANGQRRRLTREMGELDEATVNLVQPDPVADPSDILEEMEPALEEGRAELATLRRFVESMGKEGLCPTCGTTEVVGKDGTHASVESLLAEKRQQMTRLAEVVAQTSEDCRKLTANWAAFNKASVEYRRRVDEALATGARITREMDELGPEVPEPDTTRLNVLVKTGDKAERALADAKSAAVAAVSALGRYRDTLSIRQTSLKELEAIAAGLPSDAEVAAWRDQLAKRKADEMALAEVTGECKAALGQMDTLQVELAGLRKRMKRAAGAARYRGLLEGAVALLHRDAFPAARVQARLASLRSAWSDMLELFAVPFGVVINDSLGSDAYMDMNFPFGDGYAPPATKLSGGERCVAALGLMVAANRLFARGTGLLMLDEPTYGLNDQRLDLLPGFMRRVQTYASATGLQVLLITHEERLFTGFDNVIRVERPAAAA